MKTRNAGKIGKTGITGNACMTGITGKAKEAGLAWITGKVAVTEKAGITR